MCFNDNVKSPSRTKLLRQWPLWRLWNQALDAVSPESLMGRPSAAPPGLARLFWGKAAQASWRARRSGCLSLVISPDQRPAELPSWQRDRLIWVTGEHPMPEAGSYE